MRVLITCRRGENLSVDSSVRNTSVINICAKTKMINLNYVLAVGFMNVANAAGNSFVVVETRAFSCIILIRLVFTRRILNAMCDAVSEE